jgi:hypothetical protein
VRRQLIGRSRPRYVSVGSSFSAGRCERLPRAAKAWETKVADRTSNDSACPCHMGNRVHPAESLAAYYPWLAREWHPSHNTLRPDQVSRASAREVVWRREFGHEWSAAIYQRTLSGSGCPERYRLEAVDVGRSIPNQIQQGVAPAVGSEPTTKRLTDPEYRTCPRVGWR